MKNDYLFLIFIKNNKLLYKKIYKNNFNFENCKLNKFQLFYNILVLSIIF